MDTPFIFKDKEGKWVNIVKDPNAVTLKEVKHVAEKCKSSDDQYEKENVLWSAHFLTACLSQLQVEQLKKHDYAVDNGPLLWAALHSINQLVSQSQIKSLQHQLETLWLDKHRGEMVPTFTSRQLALCEQLEKLKALPLDVNTQICTSLMHCSNKSFVDHFQRKQMNFNLNPGLPA